MKENAYSHIVKMFYSGEEKNLSIHANEYVSSILFDIDSQVPDCVEIEIMDDSGITHKMDHVELKSGLNTLNMDISDLNKGNIGISVVSKALVEAH